MTSRLKATVSGIEGLANVNPLTTANAKNSPSANPLTAINKERQNRFSLVLRK
ncbi:MAG: hypothetical protein AAGE92_02345 [Cyanobacteria bacterium P01_G01_bin.4]